MGIGSLLALCTLFYLRRQDRSVWVKQLRDPEQRDSALYNLLIANGYERHWYPLTPENCAVNEVVVCPQERGNPLYAVFVAGKYDEKQGRGPGKRLGHLVLFDSRGRMEKIYINNNSVKGVFEDINADGTIEDIESFTVDVSKGECCSDCSARVMYVVPIVRKAKPLLMVAYEVPGFTSSSRSWHLNDTDGDGVPEIEIGRRLHPADDLAGPPANVPVAPELVYRWSPENKTYEVLKGNDKIPYRRMRDIDSRALHEYCDRFVAEKQRDTGVEGSPPTSRL